MDLLIWLLIRLLCPALRALLNKTRRWRGAFKSWHVACRQLPSGVDSRAGVPMYAAG